jgi:hypothetical protein
MLIPLGEATLGHCGIDCKFVHFREFEFLFETALGYISGDWETCFDEKTRGKISCQFPFKDQHYQYDKSGHGGVKPSINTPARTFPPPQKYL